MTHDFETLVEIEDYNELKSQCDKLADALITLSLEPWSLDDTIKPSDIIIEALKTYDKWKEENDEN